MRLLKFTFVYNGRYMDTRARIVINVAWARGLWKDGRYGASRAAAGLA